MIQRQDSDFVQKDSGMPVAAIADFPSSYEQYFAVVRATTPALRYEAYRLRYQVYCVENPFEDPSQHAGECETDQEDDRSVHTLLLYRRTGEAAGTSRVILPQKERFRPLPVAGLLSEPDRRRFDEFPAYQTAEVSRFAVSKQFRRRRGEERYADIALANGDAASPAGERRLMPYITLGLLRGVFGICLEHGVTHIAAVMEPPLIRILHRLGLEFERIGGLVEHHGMRQPCIARLDDLTRQARDSASLVWQYAGRYPFAEQSAGLLAEGAIDPAYERGA
jgi:N-acyl amino acid synthase of PEP-CTERM/exosortase system